MRLLFVADGGSPIARSWIEYFIAGGHEVHLVSSREGPPMEGLRSYAVVPVAFSGLGGGAAARAGAGPEVAAASPAQHAEAAASPARPVTIAAESSAAGTAGASWWRSAASIGLRTWVRHWLGPLTVPLAARRLRAILEDRRPELVHAMRIPFEGALATAAGYAAPLLVSTWGNDLTLHAPASPLMRWMTRRALQRADGLHADCERDRRLAAIWGFDPLRPSVALPGNGGVRREIFYAGPPGEAADPQLRRLLHALPLDAPLVVNPRGFRAYVRNDSFFRSVPHILERHPQARFACPAMAGERRAERWIERLGVGGSVVLLPKLAPSDLAALLRRAQVMVSPSEHDGTPNTLLEAMACGAYPVLGRLESVAEWIDDGVNGALVSPDRPDLLAEAVSRALDDRALREQAAEINRQRIAERAEYSECMARAERFYGELLAG